MAYHHLHRRHLPFATISVTKNRPSIGRRENRALKASVGECTGTFSMRLDIRTGTRSKRFMPLQHCHKSLIIHSRSPCHGGIAATILAMAQKPHLHAFPS